MNVLITGSSSGLGYSLAKKFKEMGYNVFGISRSTTNLDINKIVCNFKNLDDIKPKLKELIGDNGFEYVFLNAGILGNLNKLSDIDISEFDEIYKVNVLSNKIILDYLNYSCKVKNVIGISSGAALKTYFGWSLYCSSKAAFRQLISSYSDEFNKTHYTSLAPGIIKTKMQDQIYNEDVNKIPSVKKFHKMYDSMDSPDIVTLNIIENLSKLRQYNSGEYVDLRNINK